MRLFRAGTGWLAVHRLAAMLAPLGGWLALAVPGVRRRAASNIALVWPGMRAADRRGLVREAGASALRTGIEYIHFDRWLREVDLDVGGIDHLLAAKRSGRGVVLVTAHYGMWEGIRLAARRRGVECGLIYRAFNNRSIDAYAQRQAALNGTPILQKGRRGMRAMRRHLTDGGAVLILVDQRNTGAPLIDFLGHPAETVTVAASLAQHTGAELVPAVARRLSGGRQVEVRFASPVDTADPVQAMHAVNARIGEWICADPGQWFWFHRRWRRARG